MSPSGVSPEIIVVDLVLIAESTEELNEKVMRRKECREAKGLKMNTSKPKVMMVSAKNSCHVETLLVYVGRVLEIILFSAEAVLD